MQVRWAIFFWAVPALLCLGRSDLYALEAMRDTENMFESPRSCSLLSCRGEEAPARFRAVVGYQGGPVEVEVDELSSESFTLVRDHLQSVLECSPLRYWLENHHDEASPGREYTQKEEEELAELIVREIRARDPRIANEASRYTISSVIYRYQDPQSDEASYTNVVHRDLSEEATQNMREHHQQLYYYNAWIPREPVLAYPLGMILPDTVDLSNEPTGFMGLENDRTGLAFSSTHRWVYQPGMVPGDLLLWHSDVVYHSALVPINPVHMSPSKAPRNSLDMRIYFNQAS
jgi:hypothetical protein